MSRAPDWDLSAFFADVTAPDFAAYRRALGDDARALRGRCEGLAAIGADPAGWAEVLLALEDFGARGKHLGCYLGCRTAADATDEASQRESAGLDELRQDTDKAWVAVRAALRTATDAEFAALVADPRLSDIRYYLGRVRERAAQAMEPALEGLAAELVPTALRAWGRLYDQVSGTLRFALAVPGRPTVEHPVAMTRTLLEDPDPEVRRAAQLGSGQAWASVADTTAACLNAIAGTRLTLYRRRGITDFLEPALFDAAISRRTLDAMLGAVRARQEIGRRYLRAKARRLALPVLGFQDLLAPLPRTDAARLPWPEAQDRVRRAFGSKYPGLAELAEHAFAERWIDWQPRPGKRPGGFCSSSPVLGESRVFMTFHGSLGDVQTLAHELGHAFHNWVMRDQRPWARAYPMTLAETASTFAEEMVVEAALADPATSPADRDAMLDARLQDAAVFLLNIPMRFDFEQQVYAERAAGELSVRRFKDLILDAERRNYGDAVDPEQLDPWFWSSKLHFFLTDVAFYNFPYTFGYLFSKGIVARFRAEGAGFLARYEQLLRATGGDTAEGVARAVLGVDLETPDFWHGAIDLLEDDLAGYEAATPGIVPA
jgi:oligoendopeptidase F